MGWIRASLVRKRKERVLDDEIRQHIDFLTREYEQSGMSPEEARRAAEVRFGRVSSVKERVRDQNGIAQVEALLQDLRFAARTFGKQPGFTAVLLLTLALGIGANTAVYSVLHAVLLKPLPLPEPDRIVYLWEQDRVNHTTREGASYPDYQDLKRDSRQFLQLAASQPMDATLTGEGEPERVQAARVTSNYFTVLGVRPVLGRVFGPGEPGILLSHALWVRKFGSAAGVVGRVVKLDGFTGTILGVMPPEADSIWARGLDLWTALEAVRNTPRRGQHTITVLGRLRRGATVEQAQSEVSGIMQRLEAQYPNDNRGRGAIVIPLHEDLAGNLRPALRLLTGAVALLLVVGCLNVANLLMARASARSQEMAIRVSLGAGRRRLARQLLTETLVLAVSGAGVGLLVASAGIRALVALAPPEMPLVGRAAIDWNSMGAAGGITLVSWLIFGLLPALRSSGIAPAGALREAHSTASRESMRLRHALVMTQLAITCVLVIMSGLLIRSFWHLQRTNLGYDPTGTVTLRMHLPETRYSTPQFPEFKWPQGLAFLDQLKQAAGAVPGVDVASIAMEGPNRLSWTTRVSVVGRPARPEEDQEEAQVRTGDPDYVKAVGARLVQGRFFNSDDRNQAPPVAVVNEAFVRRYFPAENPVGQRIDALFGPRQIVGVIGDMRYAGPAAVPAPTMYFPVAQFALPDETLIVRTGGDAVSLVPALRRVLRDLDSNIAPFDVAPVESALLSVTARERFTMSLLTSFALLALTLAIVGIYGAVAYSVGRRKKEIALRMALGARASDVFRRIVGGMLLRSIVGVTAGIAIAVATGQLLQPLVFDTSTRDPATYAVVSFVLFAAAFLGAAIPASRAVRMNAVETLRED